MNRSPDPPPIVPSCGNCCNAQKHPKAVGRIICTALPPAVIAQAGMARNIYPELDAAGLGCNLFWNVNAQLFHLIGQAITLAAGSQEVVRGQSESSTKDDGGA